MSIGGTGSRGRCGPSSWCSSPVHLLHGNRGGATEAGLAFGVRGPDDFYLLHASALHDVFILERNLHGEKRDLREARVRLHGNEWHDMRIEVRGDRVAVLRDGQPLFEERGVVDTDGGLGLWARVTSAGCFSGAEVAPLPPVGHREDACGSEPVSRSRPLQSSA